MMIVTEFIGKLNFIFQGLSLCDILESGFLLALSPTERWSAARRLDTNFMAGHWFIIIASAILVVLVALLVLVSYNRMVELRKAAEQMFVEFAQKRGLSIRERQILRGVVRKSGLRRNDAIFTMEEAFEKGVAGLIEESSAQSLEENEQLRAGLSFLREKLGFKSSKPIVSHARSQKASSRQIPEGKTLHITRRRRRDSPNIEATIIKNDDMELTVRIADPVETKSGEPWRAWYHFGASIWEFDTTVVRCDGDILVLDHSDDVRFVNRRRFPRVSAKMQAMVALFPFTKELASHKVSEEKGSKTKRSTRGSIKGSWGLPDFVPATITELAGPGLRMDVPLEVNVGDRVLVIFRLDGKVGQMSNSRRAGKKMTSKIIEDIGEVRHTTPLENGTSIAVELIGLSDTDVNELIRVTNAASSKNSKNGQDVSAGVAEEEEEIIEAAV